MLETLAQGQTLRFITSRKIADLLLVEAKADKKVDFSTAEPQIW